MATQAETTRARLIEMQTQAETISTILRSMIAGVGTSGSNADSRHILQNVETRGREITRIARALGRDTFAGAGYAARELEAN